MRRRVVISGVGIISSLGNSYEEVADSLSEGKSGVVSIPKWRELKLRSTIGGSINGIEELTKNSGIAKTNLACMPMSSLYCALAAQDAILRSGLGKDELSSRMTGCIVGTGISSVSSIHKGGELTYQGRAGRMSPYTVAHSMGSSASANLSCAFGIGGRSYSISSACSTSTHNIGHAFELVRNGTLDCARGRGRRRSA